MEPDSPCTPLGEKSTNWSATRYRYEMDFCRMTYKTGSIKFAITKTKSRDVAPYFVDLMPLASFPSAFQLSAKMLVGMINNEVGAQEFSRITAASTKVLPLVAVSAYTLRKPMLFVRDARTKGRMRKVEGVLYPGDKVLIVDDLLSTGKTGMQAIEKLRSEGALVEDMVVLLDIERGGKERLEREGVHLHAFMTIRRLAEHLEKMLVMTSDERKIIYQAVKSAHA